MCERYCTLPSRLLYRSMIALSKARVRNFGTFSVTLPTLVSSRRWYVPTWLSIQSGLRSYLFALAPSPNLCAFALSIFSLTSQRKYKRHLINSPDVIYCSFVEQWLNNQFDVTVHREPFLSGACFGCLEIRRLP